MASLSILLVKCAGVNVQGFGKCPGHTVLSRRDRHRSLSQALRLIEAADVEIGGFTTPTPSADAPVILMQNVTWADGYDD